MEELTNLQASGGWFGREGRLPLLWRRVLEILVINLICSIPVAILILIGLIPETHFYFGAGLSAIAFLILNLICLRDYILFAGSVKKYLVVNYLAYLIYAAIALGLWFLVSETVYNFLFLQTNIFGMWQSFSPNAELISLEQLQRQLQLSAIGFFHLAMVVVILLAPGTIYLFLRKEKNPEDHTD